MAEGFSGCERKGLLHVFLRTGIMVPKLWGCCQRVRLWALATVLLHSFLACMSEARAADGCVINTDATGLRMAAVYAPLPLYPPETVQAARYGVVVVWVRVAPEGRVKDLSFLESLDGQTAASVRRALKLWRFSPWAQRAKGGNCPLEGRLVFYFTMKDGVPLVRDAAAEAIAARPGRAQRQRR